MSKYFLVALVLLVFVHGPVTARADCRRCRLQIEEYGTINFAANQTTETIGIGYELLVNVTRTTIEQKQSLIEMCQQLDTITCHSLTNLFNYYLHHLIVAVIDFFARYPRLAGERLLAEAVSIKTEQFPFRTDTMFDERRKYKKFDMRTNLMQALIENNASLLNQCYRTSGFLGPDNIVYTPLEIRRLIATNNDWYNRTRPRLFSSGNWTKNSDMFRDKCQSLIDVYEHFGRNRERYEPFGVSDDSPLNELSVDDGQGSDRHEISYLTCPKIIEFNRTDGRLMFRIDTWQFFDSEYYRLFRVAIVNETDQPEDPRTLSILGLGTTTTIKQKIFVRDFQRELVTADCIETGTDHHRFLCRHRIEPFRNKSLDKLTAIVRQTDFRPSAVQPLNKAYRIGSSDCDRTQINNRIQILCMDLSLFDF